MFKSIYEFFFGPKIVYGEKHDSYMNYHKLLDTQIELTETGTEKMIIFNPATQEFSYTTDDSDMPTGIPVIIMSNQSMDFDPNKQKQPNQIWATYIPGRSPAFKTYTKRSYAISSLHYRYKYVKGSNYTQKEISNDLKLYKFVDGLWKEIDFTRVFDVKGKIEVNDTTDSTAENKKTIDRLREFAELLEKPK